MNVAIHLFGRDLRVTDHLGLQCAAGIGEVLPVLVIDRRRAARLARSPRRAAFFCAAVAALERAIRARGGRLVVRRGELGATVRALARAAGASAVVWAAAYDGEGLRADLQLRHELEEYGLRAVVVHDAPAVSPEEIERREGGGYRVFTAYLQAWSAARVEPTGGTVRFAPTELQSEPLPEPPEFDARIPTTDERQIEGVEERFARYLNGDALGYLDAMRTPALDATTHLGPHLSFGTISARAVVRAIRDRLADPFLLAEERLSLRALLRSLAMRDFLLQLSWYNPESAVRPLQEQMADFPFARDHPALDAWREGSTGYPLVDAGIRQLRETGWMHPLVRRVAASFLCFDLGVDWRIGLDEWDCRLIEDEPALATGNWQWIAGVGADVVQFPRIFNPERQRRRYDPSGTYVRRWIPNLADVAPRRASDDRQLALPILSTTGYPPPVVDHEREARAFLARYHAHRMRSSSQSLISGTRTS